MAGGPQRAPQRRDFLCVVTQGQRRMIAEGCRLHVLFVPVRGGWRSVQVRRAIQTPTPQISWYPAEPSAFGFAGASCPRVLGGSDRTWLQSPVHIHAPRATCSTMARTCGSQRDLMPQLLMVPCKAMASWLHGPHRPHCPTGYTPWSSVDASCNRATGPNQRHGGKQAHPWKPHSGYEPLVDTEDETPPDALKSDQSLKCGCAL